MSKRSLQKDQIKSFQDFKGVDPALNCISIKFIALAQQVNQVQKHKRQCIHLRPSHKGDLNKAIMIPSTLTGIATVVGRLYCHVFQVGFLSLQARYLNQIFSGILLVLSALQQKRFPCTLFQ